MAQQAQATVQQGGHPGVSHSAIGNGWVERATVDRRRVDRPGIRDRRSGGGTS
jgi:hypothetical protein